MIESGDLGFVDGLASEGLARGAMDAFADAAVISCAKDFGENYVIVEHVGFYRDGLGDGLVVLLFFLVVQCTMDCDGLWDGMMVLMFLFFLVLQYTIFEGSVPLDNADLIIEIIITP